MTEIILSSDAIMKLTQAIELYDYGSECIHQQSVHESNMNDSESAFKST